ncbi:MAG: hypothetical protein IJX67_05030 [Oscillospiraceae bacterium]|nr:hypothetical protein [Oscillospiraceae bacterium]
MDFIKSCGQILRVKLNKKEQKAFDQMLSEEIRKASDEHEKEEMAVVAWVLHQRLGWVENGIRNFMRDYYPILRELNTHYELGVSDTPWLCSKKLKDSGIDFDKIYAEITKEGN